MTPRVTENIWSIIRAGDKEARHNVDGLEAASELLEISLLACDALGDMLHTFRNAYRQYMLTLDAKLGQSSRTS
jgi:hypothetical protein